MRGAVIVIVFASLGSFSATAGDSYLCVTDISTGFAFDKGKEEWHSTVFSPPHSKYLVSKSTREKVVWEVKEVGYQYAFILCKDDFDEYGNLFCTSLGTEFRMNNKTMRFLAAFLVGYWSDKKGQPILYEGANTPSLMIGKCSPL